MGDRDSNLRKDSLPATPDLNTTATAPAISPTYRVFHVEGPTYQRPGFRQIHSSWSAEHVTGAITWNSSDGGLRRESLLLALTDQGQRMLKDSWNSLSASEAIFLKTLVEQVLLAPNKNGRRAIEAIVDAHPMKPHRFKISAISAAQPIFHDRGAFKDVYLMHFLAIDESHKTCFDLLLAMKVSQRKDSISDVEIEYHEMIAKHQDSRRCVSTPLGNLSLESSPELAQRGSMVLFETFERGSVVGMCLHGSDIKRHLRAAVSVVECMFRIARVAVANGRGHYNSKATLDSIEEYGSRFRVHLPADINTKNFTQDGKEVVMVDCGEHHPSQTFTDLVLRLTRYYFVHVNSKLDIRRSSTMLPLTELFRAIERNFGITEGRQLLAELEISLTLMSGGSRTELYDRHNPELVDALRKFLIRQYRYDCYEGRGYNLGRFVRSARSRLNEQTNEAILNDDISREQRVLFRAGTGPLLFSERQLRRIAEEVRHYLEIAVDQETDFFVHSRDFAKRIQHLGKFAPVLGNPRPIEFKPRNSVSQSQLLDSIVHDAFYLTPFPYSGAVRLAFYAAQWFSRYNYKRFKDANEIGVFAKRVLGIAGVLTSLLPDDTFMEELGKLIVNSGKPLAVAEPIKDRSSVGIRGRVEALEYNVGHWLGLLVAIGGIYYVRGEETFKVLNSDLIRFCKARMAVQAVPIEDVLTTLIVSYPELKYVDGEKSEFSSAALLAIQDAARQICVALRSRHVPDRMSFPQLPLLLQPSPPSADLSSL